jgi:hypothetical protein
MRKKKLLVTRETVRALASDELHGAGGAVLVIRTVTCDTKCFCTLSRTMTRDAFCDLSTGGLASF